MPVVEVGEKILVIERRMFDGDVRRHFAGEVLAVEGAVARARGWAFVFDAATASFVRKPEERIRIVPVDDARLLVLVLPEELDLERLVYRWDRDNHLFLTDDRDFRLDVDEFASAR